MERLARETRARPTDAHHIFIGEDELSYCVPSESQQRHRALCNHEGLGKAFARYKGVASTHDVTKWLRENDPSIYHPTAAAWTRSARRSTTSSRASPTARWTASSTSRRPP